MQPRSLSQILAELSPIYDPEVQNVRKRQSLIPGQIAEEEKGLQAKQTSAFEDILGGARRRGLGFSGIPLSEQAKYTSTEYLPALARLRQKGKEDALSLEDAVLGINERKQTAALGMRQYEQQRYDAQQEQLRREAEARRQAAASASAFSPSFGGGGGATVGSASATALQRGDKGFSFTDNRGRPISAAAYALAKGIPFRSLLEKMASAGDRGASTALGFVGNDFGYDPRKVTSSSLANLYNNLVWGTGRSANPLPAWANNSGLTISGSGRNDPILSRLRFQ